MARKEAGHTQAERSGRGPGHSFPEGLPCGTRPTHWVPVKLLKTRASRSASSKTILAWTPWWSTVRIYLPMQDAGWIPGWGTTIPSAVGNEARMPLLETRGSQKDRPP